MFKSLPAVLAALVLSGLPASAQYMPDASPPDPAPTPETLPYMAPANPADSIQPIQTGPEIRAPNPTDTPLPPNAPYPGTFPNNPAPPSDAPTYPEMNPNTDPVVEPSTPILAPDL